MKKAVAPLAVVCAVLATVLLIVKELFFSDSVNYYVTSLAILALSLLPFFISFERKKISAREVTLIATLIALAVVGRAAFYLIPQVKPIAAVVIASAACLGAERGYVIGVFSAFVSNFIFGQGFWTPFQMVALGMVGLIAGIVFKYIEANRITLSLLGFILAFAVYGIIVDFSTVISAYGNNIDLSAIISVYASGVPFSAVFGLSTAVFLLMFGEDFVKKINRVNKKYNLLGEKYEN
ncbi:ECF transporter S component [uncultured Eubacterium sp.]|uniref:ECF transporter S component n=1 Tax=uncultured Eubacterium sp. TaxID=165185 RepID=UPI0015B1EDF8|nr:ECF transporter S component [uncultured Eubacterium sp.]